MPDETTPPVPFITLDSEALESLRALNMATGENLLNRVIPLFLRSAPEDIRALRTALKHLDCNALDKIAHSFKSACGSLGAFSLQDNAASIEAIAKQGITDGVAALLTAIETDLPKVLAALTQELDMAIACPHSAAAKPKRVLLVEDNELNQEVATALLRQAAMVVDAAMDGVAAVCMVQQVGYDLVLMDMQMPVMDGLTATREIRKDPQFKSLPIIAMTANAMSSDRDLSIEAGMNDYVAKPIEPEMLFAALAVARSLRKTGETAGR